MPKVVRALLKAANYNKNELPYTNQTNSKLLGFSNSLIVDIRYTLEFDAMGTVDDYNQEVKK